MDGSRQSIGVLIASKDTKYILFLGILAQWITYLVPVYIAVHYFGVSIDKVFGWVVCNHLFMLSPLSVLVKRTMAGFCRKTRYWTAH